MPNQIAAWVIVVFVGSIYSMMIWLMWSQKIIEVPKVWMVLVIFELYMGNAMLSLYNSTQATHWPERTLSLIVMAGSFLYLVIYLPKVRIPE
jgi:hypothetical protein